ncbi:MAG: CHAT domain-containing tetratricopeptide repeat protein [Flavobacteriaceae bacterium]
MLKQVLLKKIRFLFFCIPVFGNAQDYLKKQFDSLFLAEISVSEKMQKVETFLEKSNFQDSLLLAEMYYEYSKWNWSKAKDERKSKYYARKELALRKTFKADSVRALLLRNLYNLGYLYHHATLPEHQNALAYFDTLISLTRQNDIRLGNVYRERGDIYDAMGDFQRALENYHYSETLFKELERPDLQLKTLINISGTYASKGDSLLLSDFFKNNNVIASFKEKILSENQKAMVLFNTAAMYNTTKEYERAFTPLRDAMVLFQKNKDSLNIYKSLSLLGILNNKKENFKESQKTFESTLLYAKDNKLLRSATFNNLADLQKRQGKWGEAFTLYRRALYEIIDKNIGPPQIASLSYEDMAYNPFKKIIFGYLIDLGNAYIERWDQTKDRKILLEAEKLISLTDKIADDLFLESEEEVSKLSWRKKASQCYVNGVTIYHELNDPQKVFYYMEKNKGLLLLENILSVTAKKRAQIPSFLMDREYEMLEAIQQMQMKMLDAKENKIQRRIKDSLFELKSKFQKFIDSLEEKYPAYYNYKKQLAIISLEEVLKTISEKDIILEYTVGKEYIYILLIVQKEVLLKKVKNNTPYLREDIRQFQQFLNRPLETPEALRSFQNQAQQLFDLLIPIPDATTYLKDKRIIIIPDGDLHYIPFEVLTLSQKLPLPQAYLISFGDVLYKYSLSVDSEMLKLATSSNAQWAAYLPTKFKDNYQNPLLYTQEEQSFLKPYYREHIYGLENATKDAFITSFKECSVVHISTHGSIGNQGPWLAFYDEPLLIQDLYFLDTQKEMVVLSACKTSEGALLPGEGVFSITRGFINVGAKSVVSALWNLNEKSSGKIISQYYKSLESGKRKSEALKEAKLQYLASHSNTSEASPYYWAAITVMGNDSPLVFTNSNNLAIIFVLLGLLFLVIIIRNYYTKRCHTK